MEYYDTDDVSTDKFNSNITAEEQNPKRRRHGHCTPTNLGINGAADNGTAVFDPEGNNRFRPLADIDIISNKFNGNTINKPHSNTKTTSVKEIPTASTNKFCPPIFLYNANIQYLVKQLEAKSPKIHFKIKNVNKNKSKLYLSDATVHTEMMTLLKEKKISSYSFTPRELKQISLVLRGMYHGTIAEELKYDLDDIIPNVISKVTKFNTPYSLKKNEDTGLFLVTLLPGKTLSDVAHIKYILSQSISWEKPKKKNNEIQCKRCQHWGHIAKNCNSAYKCVKCDQNHLPGECSHNNDKNLTPKCVNCGEEGHPANWRGCSFYKSYVQKKKLRIREAQEIKQTANKNTTDYISKIINPNKSFASFFQKTDPTTTSDEPKRSLIVKEFLKLAELFLEPEEITLEQELNTFLEEYKNMSKAEAKGEFHRLLKKVQSVHWP